MLQARVEHLLHPKHFRAKQFLHVINVSMSLVDALSRVRKPDVDGARKIVQTLIVN